MPSWPIVPVGPTLPNGRASPVAPRTAFVMQFRLGVGVGPGFCGSNHRKPASVVVAVVQAMIIVSSRVSAISAAAFDEARGTAFYATLFALHHRVLQVHMNQQPSRRYA